MSQTTIARHRTAIRRNQLSRPIRLALEHGLIADDASVFDYGCGHGDDLRALRRQGITARGWDPTHSPETELRASHVVNLGYVLNVIESPAERSETLKRAWSLTQSVLVVAARLAVEGPGGHDRLFGDGYLTRLNTFQKYYDQGELRDIICSALGEAPIAAGPGVFYVFRDQDQRVSFLASRQRRRATSPRVRRTEVLYEQHKELLEPLSDFVRARGRLPKPEELPESVSIAEVLGSVRRAFRVIKRATDEDSWEQIRQGHARDLLVFLALARFEGRPNFSKLSPELQLDVRAFFSTYRKACARADELLFGVGEQAVVGDTCRNSAIGKQTPTALYVHVSAVPLLDPMLRVYEGCARAYMGTVGAANIVKLHRHRPAITYLSYPTFDTAPHPDLTGSLLVSLDGPKATFRDYHSSTNPPILHRKEEFVADDYPGRDKFARLTRQEEKWELYTSTTEIGTREMWDKLVSSVGLSYRGHRLVRKKDSL